MIGNKLTCNLRLTKQIKLSQQITTLLCTQYKLSSAYKHAPRYWIQPCQNIPPARKNTLIKLWHYARLTTPAVRHILVWDNYVHRHASTHMLWCHANSVKDMHNAQAVISNNRGTTLRVWNKTQHRTYVCKTLKQKGIHGWLGARFARDLTNAHALSYEHQTSSCKNIQTVCGRNSSTSS